MNPDKAVSTTALAKLLGIDAKQIFRLLADKHWIKRLDGRWRLLAKGEFEGGKYQASEQYGEYIIWPQALADHAIFKQPKLSLLGAAQLAQDNQLSARQMNRLLAALGWIKPALKGWQLTQLGADLGGVIHKNEDTGASYVLWPCDVQEAPDYQRALKSINAKLVEQGEFIALSGLRLRHKFHLDLANYLYLADIRFSYHARLNVAKDFYGDFYLPQIQLYIDVWGTDEDPHQLVDKLAKQDWFKQSPCRCLELSTAHFEDLDKQLSLLLMDYGLAVY